MPQPLARIYGSQATASAVLKQLHERGLSGEAVAEITGSTADPVGAITAAGVPESHAKVYAEAVGRGETVVLVCPPFGYAKAATEVLDSHHSISVDLPAASAPASAPKAKASAAAFDGATPLSSWFGWKVLSDDPTPLSSKLGWSVLKTDPSSSSTLESIRKQSNEPGPLSRALGWPLLASSKTPLSEKLGWETSSAKAAPLSEKLGWKVLLTDPTPLSSRLGWPVLSK
jgi:hypothetical protein